MNAGPERSNDRAPQELPAWEDCDFFCIQDYADASRSACGWRGRCEDARREKSGMKLLCPRCGSATLLRIPRDVGRTSGA